MPHTAQNYKDEIITRLQSRIREIADPDGLCECIEGDMTHGEHHESHCPAAEEPLDESAEDQGKVQGLQEAIDTVNLYFKIMHEV